MDDLALLEESFQTYSQNITDYIPEGVVPVDINLLQRFDLLDPERDGEEGPPTTRFFHVIETEQKITLYNDHFVIWIVPDNTLAKPVTYTMIALKTDEQLKLEVAFSTSGVYNSSKLVLKILEKYLMDIKETEDLIKLFG